jgi:hypothetical protein
MLAIIKGLTLVAFGAVVALQWRRRRRQLRALGWPARAIRDLVPGARAKLVGRVRLIDGGHAAPLTGTPCLAYEVHVLVRKDLCVSGAADFVLVDDTGEILVRTGDVVLDLLEDVEVKVGGEPLRLTRFISHLRPGMPPPDAAYLCSRYQVLTDAPPISWVGFSATERRIHDGDLVAVVGEVVDLSRSADGVHGYRRAQPQLELRGGAGGLVLGNDPRHTRR